MQVVAGAFRSVSGGMTQMQVLMMSHGHLLLDRRCRSRSYNLFQGLNGLPNVRCHYLARVGPPIQPHRGTPFMTLRQKEHETLLFANNYDYFRLSNRDLDTLVTISANSSTTSIRSCTSFPRVRPRTIRAVRFGRMFRSSQRSTSISRSATTTGRWSKRRPVSCAGALRWPMRGLLSGHQRKRAA